MKGPITRCGRGWSKRRAKGAARRVAPTAARDRSRHGRRLHPNDVRRVIRAIEVYETTGSPLSEHLATARRSEPALPACHGRAHRPRPVLYRRIEERVDRQIQSGLVDEVRRLMEQYGPLPVARQALGYKEIAAYLRGECSLERAIELLKRDTRRFAKRQFTWFRRDERIRLVRPRKACAYKAARPRSDLRASVRSPSDGS